jgi:hypothetical protein
VVSDYPFGIFKFSYDHNVTPLPVENAEITCNDYVLAAYDKICYIGKVLENDLSDKTVHIVFIVVGWLKYSLEQINTTDYGYRAKISLVKSSIQ